MGSVDTAPADKIPDASRLCTTTWILKDLRTKYCAQTRACVEEFGHYCVWLNCAIGKRNHRPFVMLAFVEMFTQWCHIYLLIAIARHLVEYTTFPSWLFAVITTHPLICLMLFLQGTTAPWVCVLLLHQGRLVAMNLTTNEMMSAHRYEHFWVTQMSIHGHPQKAYRNPFHKGSMTLNCLDFWWHRNRADRSLSDLGCGKPQCCQHHHH